MRYRYIFKDRRDYENTMLLLVMFGAGAIVAGIAIALATQVQS